MRPDVFVSIFLMALVTYLIRVLPLTLIRREIKNRYIRSFLYYVPYVTLAVMTFPAILDATDNPLAGAAALAAGGLMAWRGKSLFTVSMICCAVVLVIELLVR